MGDFEKLRKELLNGDKAQKVKNIVNSAEGKRIGKNIDGEALRKAAESGDQETLSNILGKVLSTDDGKDLVRRIEESLGNKQ
ncbi:MAG: hypothetical protein GXY26_03440 [Clostridiales bacterium]|mgnify:CR=1 FL=1|jgi:hypothetical protein|nr:hypothetical protein [Clostridiales bacterium]